MLEPQDETRFLLANVHVAKSYILGDFPDGYVLRFIKPNYYLYGHPTGVRYRGPGDFVPHLLWILSASVDRADCFCAQCMSMVEKERGPARGAVRAVSQGPSSGAVSVPAQAGQIPQPQQPQQVQQLPQQVQQIQQPQQTQQQVIQQPQHTQQNPQQIQQTSQQTQYQQAFQQPQQIRQTYQANQNANQAVTAPPPSHLGMSTPSNIFRVAELVWYKDRAWRLGIVLGITPKLNNNPAGQDNHFVFHLAPLGHTVLKKPNAAKDASEMRPFLTFSVPDSPQYQGKSFTDLDWVALAEQTRHSAEAQKELEILGLEASKVAARTINNCFSLFNKQTERVQAAAGYTVEFYSGIYLGAEMVLVNDPVRVTPPQNLPEGEIKPTTVMRIDDIVLLIPHGRGIAADLQFRGTVYHLTRQPEHEIDAATAAEAFGGTFREEVDFRNALLDPADRQLHGRWIWKTIEKPAFRNDDQIFGRFYVSHKLMQILMPEKLAEARQTRVVQEASTLLNTRQQNGGNLPYAGRMLNRQTCLGLSITQGALNLPQGIREEFAAGQPQV